jgi:hypothetical protein
LKVQNICIKPLLEPWNSDDKLYFETAYLGEKVKKMLRQKVAQNVAVSLGYFSCSKNQNEVPKVAQLARNAKSGHPACDQLYSPTT